MMCKDNESNSDNVFCVNKFLPLPSTTFFHLLINNCIFFKQWSYAWNGFGPLLPQVIIFSENITRISYALRMSFRRCFNNSIAFAWKRSSVTFVSWPKTCLILKQSLCNSYQQQLLSCKTLLQLLKLRIELLKRGPSSKAPRHNLTLLKEIWIILGNPLPIRSPIPACIWCHFECVVKWDVLIHSCFW